MECQSVRHETFDALMLKYSLTYTLKCIRQKEDETILRVQRFAEQVDNVGLRFSGGQKTSLYLSI